MKIPLKQIRRAATIALFALAAVGGALSTGTIGGVPAARAADTSSKYQLLAPLPCVESSSVKCGGNGTLITSADFRGYIQYLFNLVIALAAVAAVFMIVWGGFTYMTTDSFYKKEEGLEKVRHAVYGLLLVLCSYLILRTVDPRLTQISDTLVPPLVNSAGQPLIADNSALLNKIAGAAQTATVPAAYDSQNAALTQQEHQAAAAQTAADQKIANIQAQMIGLGCDSGPNNDPACAQLQADLQQAQNDSSKAKADTIALGTTAAFNSFVAQTVNNPQNNTAASLDNDIQVITQQYNSQKALLQSSNSADQITALTSSYNAAIGQIKVQQDTLNNGSLDNTTLAKNLADLNNIQNNIVPTIQDPTQKAQLQSATTAAINQTKSLMSAQSSGGGGSHPIGM